MPEPGAIMKESPDKSASEILTSVTIEEVGLDKLDVIQDLNLTIFEEQRIINTFDREDLMLLLASIDGEAIAFKIGYRENRFIYYSAKGGVLPEYRRNGIARLLLFDMMDRIRTRGYQRFAFDTFPNRHPGMAVMALQEGFRITKADFNTTYRDYRLRFEKKL